MSEDPLDHRGLFDERDQAQTAAAAGTRQHVESEGARHQRRPRPTAGLTPCSLIQRRHCEIIAIFAGRWSCIKTTDRR